ncbi:hypothetical protein D3C80_1826280 [compost metagenome]
MFAIHKWRAGNRASQRFAPDVAQARLLEQKSLLFQCNSTDRVGVVATDNVTTCKDRPGIDRHLVWKAQGCL